MTPWEVVEQALARRKPPRDQKWLAEELKVTAAAITNWKNRGVPAAQFRPLANALGLTVDQIEGIAPLPWDKEMAWPFSPALHERVMTLNQDRIAELEASIWKVLDAPKGSGVRLAASQAQAPQIEHPPEWGVRPESRKRLIKRKPSG